MLVIGIDLETTGLDVEKDRITELGAVLWDCEARKPLRVLNELFWEPGTQVSPEITKLTGITEPLLQKHGVLPKLALDRLEAMATQSGAQAFVAHNGNLFDKPMLLAHCKRYAVTLPALPWIDTSVDIDYPPHIQTRKLKHLASEHDFLNPFAHRAVFDVLTMLNIFARYDHAVVFKLALEPSVLLVAHCKGPWEDNGKDTNEAKARGFRWDAAKKRWSKMVKQSQVEKPENYPFPVRQIAG